MQAMKPEDVKAVKDLCHVMLRAIKDLELNATLAAHAYSSGPTAARLKRVSMELTRALARVRGRGRF